MISNLARHSIYTRSMIAVGLVLVVITLIVAGLGAVSEWRRLDDQLHDRVRAMAARQAVAVSSATWDLNREEARLILSALTLDPDLIAAWVTDEKGRPFVQIGTPTAVQEEDVTASAAMLHDDAGKERTIGTLHVALSHAGVEAVQTQSLLRSLLLTLVQLVAVLAATYMAIRHVLDPLARVTDRMIDVAGGSLAEPVPHADRRDQVGDVARAVESLRAVASEQLTAETALRHAHEELELRVEERTAELRAEIAERKRAEADLARSQELISAVVANSPAEIFVRDLEGRFIMVNKAWEDAMGLRQAEVIGKTAREVLPLNLADIFHAQETPVREGGQVLDEEIRIALPEGDRTMHTVKFPLIDGTGEVRGVGGIISDVTELKRADAQLRQAQKMEVVGQLTGGVAHDFNNLLAVIQGNVELLRGAGEERGPMIDTVVRAVKRGAELTQRLLAFSRRQPLDAQILDLRRLTDETHGLLTRTFPETITIETKVTPDPWPVLVDQGQLENALLNLAVNARDAMPNGGHIAIECANQHLDEAIGTEDDDIGPGDFVTVTVRDSGTGMSPEVRDHAFEPFFTTKEVGQGSGLGLSMIYGFVKQSGGHVVLDSVGGAGTAVTLYLPRAYGEVAPIVEAANPAPLAGHGETILVIEDDDDVRRMAVRILESLGYTVQEAHDAETARALVFGGDGTDLVLSDIVLPGGVDGPTLAAEFSETYPEMPIVFMSGYPAERSGGQFPVSSESILLNKPFRRADLAQTVSRALAERRAVQ